MISSVELFAIARGFEIDEIDKIERRYAGTDI
jgi:hypothetical protein